MVTAKIYCARYKGRRRYLGNRTGDIYRIPQCAGDNKGVLTADIYRINRAPGGNVLRRIVTDEIYRVTTRHRRCLEDKNSWDM
jgi:hypothetical protein